MRHIHTIDLNQFYSLNNFDQFKIKKNDPHFLFKFKNFFNIYKLHCDNVIGFFNILFESNKKETSISLSLFLCLRSGLKSIYIRAKRKTLKIQCGGGVKKFVCVLSISFCRLQFRCRARECADLR